MTYSTKCKPFLAKKFWLAEFFAEASPQDGYTD